MKRFLLATGLLGLAVSTAVAAGEPVDAPTWRIGGYGTLGAGYHRSDGVTYRRDLEQAGGIESRKIGFRADTRLGVQLVGTFSPRWSATVQGLSRLNNEGSWEPSLAWGFVRYSPREGMDIRVGRLGVDIYPDGDSRHVGYANTGARSPVELFGMVTQDRFDGIDVALHQPMGDGLASFKLYGGRSRGDFFLYNQSITPADSQTVGATLEWAGEALTLRAAWVDIYGKGDYSLQTVQRALLSVPLPEAQLRASQIKTAHHLTFAAISAQYENGPFSLQTIFGWERFSQFPSYEGWGANVVAAYRMGAWKPYVSYGRVSFDSGGRSLTLPGSLAALQSAYQTVVDRLNMHQRSVGIGVRYDFAPDYALKLQADHVKASDSALLIDATGMPARDVSLTLYSVVLDFVF
ncbi:MAG: signal protein [Gammaproteobacteria bacterium]|jgi:hypothetical protein|nr:signal protein [Gammaproteobacteria bacterium]MBU0773206.1 signal protein [Gammaproteobacteria bacterium]MBU0857358.1 signal protein [Gammaproteobacteria bacterium]MBU1848941.1 signal protein [Gammaproteobacteria bacterium]